MELPILIKNSKVDYRNANIQDLIRNVREHSSKLYKLPSGGFTTDDQAISSQTLYLIQDCIQILKHLQERGYNIDIDFQVHNYEFRNYEKAGKISLSWLEDI